MDATTQPLLAVRDLSVAFRQGEREMLAVDRVSFDIAQGRDASRWSASPARASRSPRSR